MTTTPHSRHTRVRYKDCPQCAAIVAAKAAEVAARPPVEEPEAPIMKVRRRPATVEGPMPRVYEPIGQVGRAKRLAKIEAKAVVQKRHEPLTLTTEKLVEVIPATETREQWLLRAVERMRPWFPEDHPVGPVRVSVGWPSGRGSSKHAIGQCWYSTDDKVPALFVSPALMTPLPTLLHEMVHAATPQAGHKGEFVKVARGLGFTKAFTSSENSTDDLKARLADLATEMGDYPHSKVNKLDGFGRPTPQSTRMLKVICEEDGYTVRTTRKWLDVGMPSCPDGHEMKEEV